MQGRHASDIRILNLTAVVGAVMILGLEVWNLYSLNRSHNNAGWVNHTHRVIEGSNELTNVVVMAESWARGYALSNDPSFLRVYYQSKDLVIPLVNQLQSLSADNALQLRRIDTLEQLARARLYLLDQMVKMNPDAETAESMIPADVVMQDGQRLSNRFRLVIQRLKKEEESLLETRIAQLDREYKNFRMLIIIAGSLSLAIMLVLYIVLFRQLERRSETEEALSESREWFSKTLASLGDGMIATNVSGIVTFMNAAAEQLTGWSKDEAIGKPLDFVFDISDEITGLPVPNPAKKALVERRVVLVENQTLLRRKDGSRRFIDKSAAPILSDGGELFGAALICRDVTEQVEIRKKLGESENRLRRIIENSNAVITIRDKEGRYVMVNPAFEKLTGTAEVSVIGKKNLTNLRQHKNDQVDGSLMKALQEDAVITSEEEWVIPDGSLRNFVAVRFPIKDSAGEIVGIGSICTDITAQKQHLQTQHEIALREKMVQSQAHYKELANNISEMFFSMDENERFLFWNHACEWRTGRHEADVVGKYMDDVYPTDDWPELKKRLRIALQTKRPDTFTSDYHEKGKTYAMQVHVYPATHGISVLMSDVTFQRKTEREAMKLVESLQQKNKDLRQFAYIISHNLRAPIAKIQGLAGLFHDDKNAAEFNSKIISNITEELKSLDLIVNDLNDIISIREVEYQSKEFISLEEEMKHVRLILGQEIKAAKAKIEDDFSACPSVHSIKSYMHSIFLNLVSNALKYRSPDRKPVIRVTSAQEEHYSVISVQDNGLGIDLIKHGTKIFNLYKRFHHEVEGRGIGLYLVKNQVESLGGKIEVESSLGNGTLFKVYLPVKKRPNHE